MLIHFLLLLGGQVRVWLPRYISTVAGCKFQNHRFQGKIYSHWSKCSRWRPEVQTSYLVSPGQLYGRPEEDIKRIIIYSMWHLQYMRSFSRGIYNHVP